MFRRKYSLEIIGTKKAAIYKKMNVGKNSEILFLNTITIIVVYVVIKI